MTHEIEKCSCGRVIRQCRCPGPHPVRIVPDGCEACHARKPVAAPAGLESYIVSTADF